MIKNCKVLLVCESTDSDELIYDSEKINPDNQYTFFGIKVVKDPYQSDLFYFDNNKENYQSYIDECVKQIRELYKTHHMLTIDDNIGKSAISQLATHAPKSYQYLWEQLYALRKKINAHQ